MNLTRKTCLRLLLLLLALPAVAQAQFIFTTNNDGSLNIYQYTGTNSVVIIPNTTNGLPITSIGEKAFYDRIGLTNVVIGTNVTSIGEDAFYYCNDFAAITVSPNNPAYSSLAGVLFDKNADTLIEYPTGLAESYTVPTSVTSIGVDAFKYCRGLTSVMIPNSVTNIGESAFEFSTNLTRVTMGNSVTSIGLT